jgi:RNA polymerase sigma factor (sigma-70 family)
MDEQWSDVSPTPEMRLVAAEAEQELARAVAALPDSLRLPLVMHFGSCLTYREVALALGVRESTVIGRVASALRVLRRRFGAEGSR